LRKRAEAAKAAEVFFDPGQNLYADDLGRSHFSEHAQALAILSGTLNREREVMLASNLESNTGRMAPASIYFGHYVLEALAATNRYAGFFQRLREWNGLAAAGLKTPRESPEPSRSDCHGWGSHPIYHAFASILGIRPASPGFRSVQINPMPLPEGWGPIRATLPHPRGVIEVEIDSRGRLIERRVPEGVKIVMGR
jgi:alpha-L-rhamnosidase